MTLCIQLKHCRKCNALELISYQAWIKNMYQNWCKLKTSLTHTSLHNHQPNDCRVTKTPSQHDPKWKCVGLDASYRVKMVRIYPFMGLRKEEEDYLNNWNCQERSEKIPNLWQDVFSREFFFNSQETTQEFWLKDFYPSDK